MRTNKGRRLFCSHQKLFNTAITVRSSGRHLYNLLRCNEYEDPRSLIETRIPTPKMDYVNMDKRVCLKIPYVSEFASYEILRYIQKRKLPINVIFIPGTKLHDILRSSRPLDKPGCSLPHCKICDLLEDDVICNISDRMILIL